MSARMCHVLMGVAFAAILIGLARVGWWVVMHL